LDNVDDLWFFVFTFLQSPLRATTYTDEPRAGTTFGEVNDNKGFILFAHAIQQLHKRQEYIVCEHYYKP
jgi:hypothetical protein